MRREELMDAAERLFIDKGVDVTSIDDIVSAAGVAKGTFYLSFESKEVLLTALRERFVARFCTRLEKAMARYRLDDWHARLRAWVKAGVGQYLDNVALHDVIFHDHRPQDRRSMSDNQVIDQLTAFLAAGAAANAWTVENARSTAIMLFYALHGAIDDAEARGDRVNRPRLIRTITAFVERALDASG